MGSPIGSPLLDITGESMGAKRVDSATFYYWSNNFFLNASFRKPNCFERNLVRFSETGSPIGSSLLEITGESMEAKHVDSATFYYWSNKAFLNASFRKHNCFKKHLVLFSKMGSPVGSPLLDITGESMEAKHVDSATFYYWSNKAF
jgi:hypothetical protein